MKKIFVALLLLVASTAGWSQVSTGSLGGRVADPVGALIPDAKVVAKNEATGQEYTTQSSAGGLICFPVAEHGRVHRNGGENGL